MRTTLLHEKVEILVELRGVEDRRCPKCGEKVTDDEIRKAGTESPGSPKSPVFASVAAGALYETKKAGIIGKAMDNKVDWIDYQTLLWENEREFSRSMWMNPSLTGSTTLTHRCKQKIPVTFTGDVKVLKEPDKVETFLKLGLRGEKTFHWMSYIYSPVGEVDVEFGERKAKEYYAAMRNWQNQIDAINSSAERILKELKDMRLEVSFDSDIINAVNAARKKYVDALKAAQKDILDRIDTVLARVSMRPPGPTREREEYEVIVTE
ncbi:MAG: hypothetical protein OEZ48_01485 [Candidatus Bathyarchaeota archaeon]|nr:hypothetical protein [Candidatus Bathyarchaeota archaeon]